MTTSWKTLEKETKKITMDKKQVVVHQGTFILIEKEKNNKICPRGNGHML
jgi:hypothetical protein